jgi:hypothetical protein
MIVQKYYNLFVQEMTHMIFNEYKDIDCSFIDDEGRNINQIVNNFLFGLHDVALVEEFSKKINRTYYLWNRYKCKNFYQMNQIERDKKLFELIIWKIDRLTKKK